ncbi:HSP20 family molecular chaperone IbpA [Croceifilum oryzae]|uniref:HSP20 family molecular chaperone IbpA n=1 Tax=Croceifilum oryzae TaxID=1553429 RepID=A0AAJ1WSS5_9BACL|nr:Hsp20/alpha crystallin family protein [Croceifilum oryzae]MDQ0417698.1 HSP20 family molecular chaperone IbpA [Croceifilum oryzae]
MNDIWNAIRSIPWQGGENISPGNLNPTQIQSFIQKSIQQSLGEVFQSNPIAASFSGNDSGIQWDLVELMDYVIIKGELPNSVRPSEIRFFCTKSELIIETGSKGSRTTVALPCLVKEKGIRAKCKDGIFEVRLPKERGGRETLIAVEWE